MEILHAFRRSICRHSVILPIVEELYDNKEDQKKAMETYTAFFNIKPQIGTVVVGITAGLEEARSNGEEIDGK